LCFIYYIRCHVWVECVGSLRCSKRLFSGNPGFPLSSTPKFDLISLVWTIPYRVVYKPHLFASVLGQKSRVQLIHKTIDLLNHQRHESPDALVKWLRGYQANILHRSPALFGSNSVVFFSTVGFISNEDNGFQSQWIGKVIEVKLLKGIFKVN